MINSRDQGEASAVWAAIIIVGVVTAGFMLVSYGYTGGDEWRPENEELVGYPVAFEIVVLDGQGWIEMTLTSQALSPAWEENVSIDVADPAGYQHRTVCTSTELSGGECARPFGANMAWRQGTQLWVPCHRDGQHTVTVVINDHLQAQGWLDCLGAG